MEFCFGVRRESAGVLGDYKTMKHWLIKLSCVIWLLIPPACSNDDNPVTVDTGPNEPPVVAMPNPNLAELVSAPSSVEFGEKIITFAWGKPPTVYRWVGIGDFDRSTRVFASICVEGCFENLPDPCQDIHEVRLDFAWIIQEREIWAAELKERGDGYVMWNDWVLQGWANHGPDWPFDSAVDVVLGLTDQDGKVWLIGGSTTLVPIGRF